MKIDGEKVSEQILRISAMPVPDRRFIQIEETSAV